MATPRRWPNRITGIWCAECWSFWPHLRPGEPCPDGCCAATHPEVETVEGVRI